MVTGRSPATGNDGAIPLRRFLAVHLRRLYPSSVRNWNAALARLAKHPVGRRVDVILPVVVVVVNVLRDLYPWPWPP